MSSITSQGTSAGKDPLKSDSSDFSAASIFHRRIELISKSDANTPFPRYARLLNKRHTLNLAKEGHKGEKLLVYRSEFRYQGVVKLNRTTFSGILHILSHCFLHGVVQWCANRQ